MRQEHVALVLGFKALDLVMVTGNFLHPSNGELGIVYGIHLRSKVASVAMACQEGQNSTTVGIPFMRHYKGKLTAELISTLKSVKKLRDQLGEWAPPEKGWND